MINIKPYKIQTTRSDIISEIFDIDPTNYDNLLDTLLFPIIWSYDSWLNAWFPAEVDTAFVNFLKTIDRNSTVSNSRLIQIKRAGLIQHPRTVLIKQNGNVEIGQLLDGDYCRYMMMRYYIRNNHLHERHLDLEGIKRTSVNDMPLMRLFHKATENLVNTYVNEPIKSSYSFCSLYEAGSILPAHTDRPQCVYNISMMLGSNPETASLSDWPLYVKTGDSVYSAKLEIGDAVLYSGTKDLHWRDQMPDNLNNVLGVFFHYVQKNFSGSLD